MSDTPDVLEDLGKALCACGHPLSCHAFDDEWEPGTTLISTQGVCEVEGGCDCGEFRNDDLFPPAPPEALAALEALRRDMRGRMVAEGLRGLLLTLTAEDDIDVVLAAIELLDPENGDTQ